MKNIKFLSLDMIIIILAGMAIGLFLGLTFPELKIQTQTIYNKLYIKFHPESQMDTQTIIINKVTKDTADFPQNDIFAPPQNKENKIILFIKQIFTSKNTEPKPISIHDKFTE